MLHQRDFGRWLLLLAALALVAAMLGAAQPAYAATFTVNTTTDANDGTCNASNCSLREAILAANAAAGNDTIVVPAGTYQITLSPGPDENVAATGDFDILGGLSIIGAGAGSTIITANDADRVFDIDPFGGCNCTINLSDLTVAHGKGFASNFNIGGAIFIGPGATVNISNSTISDSQTVSGTGGAIENRGALTLTNVTIQNNTAKSFGGAVYTIGPLTVTNSTFSNNKAESGGALYITTTSSLSASITGSTFSGNQAVATAGGAPDDGGAIVINTDGAVSITKSTFTGNTAANNGGAIYFNDSATEAATGTLLANFNRIVGNTAAAGSGLYNGAGAASAENNWWGCNAGPSSAPCDRASAGADFNPWLQLTLTATPSSVNGGGTSALEASFLTNSVGNTLAASDMDVLLGVPIGFGATLGTISGAQTSIQSNGKATATYTAGGTSGTGSASATVDSQTMTANIAITSVATATTITSDSPDPSVVGQPVMVQYSLTASSGTPSGNVTVSDGTLSCTASVADGQCALTFTSAGAKSLTATYAGGGGFSGSTSAAEAHTVNKADTTTTITSDTPDPSAVGQSVLVSYSVSVSAPGAGTPTGSVTVSDGVDSCVGAAASGQCSITLTSGGARTLSATYSGDSSFNGSTSAGEPHSVDATAPSVTINQASGQTDPTTSSPIHFTAVFNEPVSGFTGADVALGGTAGATTAVVTEIAPNDGTTYDVAVSGITGNGTVIASIPASAATDAASNGNSASTSTDNTVSFIANNPPTANNDSYSTREDQALSVSAANGVLKNDSDADGDTPLTAVLVSGPSNAGSFTLHANGSFSYTPAANFNGSDSFTYNAKDSHGGESAPATATISVTSINDVPSFTKGPSVTVAEDSGPQTISGWATNISAGPANESGQALTFYVANNNSTLFSAQPAISPSGTLTFTPAANANGTATVAVALKDSGGTANGGANSSAPQTFTIKITPLNDAPTVSIVLGDVCTSDFSGRMLLIVSDADSWPGSLTLAANSSNTGVVANSNIKFGGGGFSRTISVSAVPGSTVRSATLTITVSDGSASSTTTLQVIAGTNQSDTINGSGGADMIFAGNGSDTVNAGGGVDLICGGNGDNTLHGDDGNDVIEGGKGNDTLHGDNGSDVLRGGKGNDKLYGGGDGDFLTGGHGADLFSGGPGIDVATDFSRSQGDTSDGT